MMERSRLKLRSLTPSLSQRERELTVWYRVGLSPANLQLNPPTFN